MGAGTALVLAAFGAALLATLVLAAYLTPRTWWRKPNARALGVLAAGTVGIGSALLWAFAPPESAHAAQRVMAPLSQLQPGRSYVVFRDLNLRAASGVGARRLAVVPAGASVSATGLRDGDWWQLTAQLNGAPVRGWASSLWLRRSDERAASGAERQAPSD